MNELKSENQKLTVTYETQIRDLQYANDDIKKELQAASRRTEKGSKQAPLRRKSSSRPEDPFDEDWMMELAAKQAGRDTAIKTVKSENRRLAEKLNYLESDRHTLKERVEKYKRVIKRFQAMQPADWPLV
eukprot:TRINITY_DN1036_c0_g1_i1.p2 TRINITY_DN1036_c0_g1~~TRINITY_DN1036_c0_g1_i1.p2  ORF type:complete len:130 (-),score=32.16 TRINITY_DN1036_c0_g1_i1:27-416(-)